MERELSVGSSGSLWIRERRDDEGDRLSEGIDNDVLTHFIGEGCVVVAARADKYISESLRSTSSVNNFFPGVERTSRRFSLWELSSLLDIKILLFS